MKKAGLFLAGTMTCAILFGILWGTGWVKFTWPVPQGNTTAADNKVAPLMILGKWEGIRKDAPFGAEFMDKGLVIFSHAGNSTDNDKALSAMIAGKYKFLDETTIEITLVIFGPQVEKYQVEVTDKNLKLVGEKETYALMRVNEFSVDFTAVGNKPRPVESKVTSPPTMKPLLTFKNHEASVEAVAFSPDGTLIASGGDDGVVIIWERTTGKVRHKLGVQEDRKRFAGSESVRSVNFSPDGSTLVTGSSGGGQLWNVDTGERRKYGFGGDHVAFSPDGTKLITATHDEIHILDLVEDKKLFSKKTPGTIKSIAVSPDGKLIASGDLSSYVRVWDATNGEQKFSYKDSRAQIFSVAFSPDSNILAADSGSLYLNLFDMKTGVKVSLKNEMANARFSKPVILADNKHLAAVRFSDDSVRLWDFSSGQERMILKGHTGPIKALAVSPDGKVIVSSSQDHTVKVWDVSSVVGPSIKTPSMRTHKDLILGQWQEVKTGIMMSFQRNGKFTQVPKGGMFTEAGTYEFGDGQSITLIYVGKAGQFVSKFSVTQDELVIGVGAGEKEFRFLRFQGAINKVEKGMTNIPKNETYAASLLILGITLPILTAPKQTSASPSLLERPWCGRSIFLGHLHERTSRFLSPSSVPTILHFSGNDSLFCLRWMALRFGAGQG